MAEPAHDPSHAGHAHGPDGHDDHAHDTSHIVQSLAVNFTIASGKGVCAFLTGSGAMLAETIHSFSDCTNQLLLLVGVKGAAKPPDEAHPLGYGRSLYFWSFLVAMLLFTGGGVFSIYEGIHKLHEHATGEEPGGFGLAIGMLLFALALEGYATFSNVRELNARRGNKGFLEYLQFTKESDLVVVFGENSAAVCGLGFALAGVGLSHWTGDPSWDAYATVAIGGVLVAVAAFLAVEIKSLLVGEGADPEIRAAIEEAARETPGIGGVLRAITLQQGPGEVLVACKVGFHPDRSAAELVSALNAFERRVKEKRKEVRWLFVEPDDHA